MKLTRWWHVATVIAISSGFVIALFAVAEVGRARLAAAAADTQRAQLQLLRVEAVQLALLNAESAHRGYLLTGDLAYLEPLQSAASQVPNLASDLIVTYKGRDERVAAAMRDLRTVAGARITQLWESIDLYRRSNAAAGIALEHADSTLETMARFRELSDIIQNYEQALVVRSQANWNREISIVRSLNLATLAVGLTLVALAVSAMVRSIRLREESVAELARQHDELKAQADAQAAELTEAYKNMQNVQEEERARLSRGLHDELGGVLLAARMDVTWMQQHPLQDRSEIEERLQRVRNALDQGIALKRRVVEELRPTLLDTMGLGSALRWQIGESCKLAGVECVARLPGDEEARFNRSAAITLFRIVQEALANVVKHARATDVEVALDVTDSRIILSIRDNGAGAPAESFRRPGAHGIAGMRHRVHVLGGRLNIDSWPGRGTRIHVEIPRANVM